MEHETSLFASPETWVAVGFLLFVGVFVYFRVHKTLAEALDKRSSQIAAEIDQARRLKAEAEQALSLYARKASEAQNEAQAIIAQAEAKALDEVRAEAVRVATAAAERLIAETVDQARGAALIDQAIAQLEKTLH